MSDDDFGVLLPGPNAWGTPVLQDIGGDTGHWWRRLDDGRLAVWCGHPRDGRLHLAPVPMAALRWPLPERSPNRDRITCALDLRSLHGPEVDEALGVATPADEVVDAWESGALVPSHDDIRRLATLTGFLPDWFYGGTLPVVGWSSLDIHRQVTPPRREPRRRPLDVGQQSLFVPPTGADSQ